MYLVGGELVPEDEAAPLGAPLQDDDEVFGDGAQEDLALGGLQAGEGVAPGRGRGQGGGVLLELGSKDIPEEPISGYEYLASSAVTASGCRGAVRDREETVTSWGRREGQRRRASQHQVTDMPACVSEVS